MPEIVSNEPKLDWESCECYNNDNNNNIRDKNTNKLMNKKTNS